MVRYTTFIGTYILRRLELYSIAPPYVGGGYKWQKTIKKKKKKTPRTE